jgi:ABC-type methionine transport system ATPase subunit
MENIKPQKVIIDLKDVCFHLPSTKILNNITATVYNGDVVFIVGKSGCGKSTLLKLTSCLSYPTSGSIIQKGIDLRNATQTELINLHRDDGYIFQDCALISNLTIFDNLALPLRYYELHSEDEIKNIIYNICETMNLMDDINNRPAALSMGEQKLAAIARALLNKPSLLFCDEPLASLDVGAQRKIKEIFKEQTSNNVTFMIVSHDLDFIKEFATRLWVIENGNLISQFTRDQIIGEENAIKIRNIFDTL